MESSRVPRLSRTMLVGLLQGEEDVDYSHIVFLILLPRSLRQSRGGLTKSSDVAVLVEIEITSDLEHLPKRELELPFVYLPGCMTLLLDPGFTYL